MTDEDAASALDDALAATDGDPECARCPKPADYFLYEAGRVEKFVCWEHVSPFSAAVDSEDADVGDDDGDTDDGDTDGEPPDGAGGEDPGGDADPRAERPVALSL